MRNYKKIFSDDVQLLKNEFIWSYDLVLNKSFVINTNDLVVCPLLENIQFGNNENAEIHVIFIFKLSINLF